MTVLASSAGEPRLLDLLDPAQRAALQELGRASRAGVAKALHTRRELGWIESQRRQIVLRH
jgi:hypothetical protein